MIQSLPAGSQVHLPFYFATRKLTSEEQAIWEEGRELPPGVGVDPKKVIVECWEPETSKSLTPEVIRVGQGEYEAVVEALKTGLWTWRGIGLTTEGKAYAATPDRIFQIMRSRAN